MRLILFLAVLALGADALFFSGAYTQAAYREISSQVEDLASRTSDEEPALRTERDAPNTTRQTN